MTGSHGAARAAGDHLPMCASETHGIALQRGNRLIAHSEGMGWKNVYASLATESPWDGPLAPVSHHCLVYCLHQSASVRRTITERDEDEALLQPRQLTIIPAGVLSHWQVNGTPDILLLYLRRSMMERIAGDAFGPDASRARIVPRLAFVDPLLEQLALAILEELQGSSGHNGYYVDGLAATIAARLMSHHTTPPTADDGLAAGKSSTNDARLLRLCAFIESSLSEDLSLAVLSSEIGMSPDHLIRTFRRQFGETPHSYVTRRRIEHAKHLLVSTNIPIAELALSLGFSDQSHLTLTFRRMVGVGPAQYRRQHKN